MKNIETYDVKHQNLTYLKNYEASDLRKKKQTLLVDVRRETSEIA